MVDKETSQEIFKRVGHLETAVSSILTRLDAYGPQLEKIASNQRINPGIVIAFVMMVLAISTPIMSNVYSRFDRQKSDVELLSEELSQFRKETTDRLMDRAHFMGYQTASNEIFKQRQDFLFAELIEMMKNRYTEEDSAIDRIEQDERIKRLEDLFFVEGGKDEN
jgi:hypothetical protein